MVGSGLLWWQQLALVMAGGALGAGGRYWMGGLLLRRIGDGLPWGTLTVNLAGSFAIGFLAVWLEGRGGPTPVAQQIEPLFVEAVHRASVADTHQGGVG